MARRDIIVIGSSTGGIEAMKTLVRDLPGDFPGSIFWVQHIGAHGLGFLPDILRSSGPLTASNARNWEEIRPGHIYVAPPDHHLLLERTGHLRITRGPKENRCRPAVDPLFRSAAEAFGPRVVGMVLTGQLDDGSAGLGAVKKCGGTAIVQHPHDALAPSMPQTALRYVAVDHCVPLAELAPLLINLVDTPVETKGDWAVPKRIRTEVRIARGENALASGVAEWGEPSFYACPECHGVLLQLKDGNHLRFRCHTGHGYSVETLVAEFAEHSEEALWNAVRALEEQVVLMRQMAKHLTEAHQQEGDALLKKADAIEHHAEVLRQTVMAGGSRAEEEPS